MSFLRWIWNDIFFWQLFGFQMAALYAWTACRVYQWKAEAKGQERDNKVIGDFCDTLQSNLAALQEQLKQAEADAYIKAENAKQRQSEIVKKGWATRKARKMGVAA